MSTNYWIGRYMFYSHKLIEWGAYVICCRQCKLEWRNYFSFKQHICYGSYSDRIET